MFYSQILKIVGRPWRAVFLLIFFFSSFSSAHLLPVHIQGAQLVNQAGQVLILRGVNLVVKNGQTPEALGFNQEQASMLHQHGLNVVRLGILWSSVEPKPNEFDDHYLQSMNNTISLLAKFDIYTLVDVHQDEYSQLYGDGAPAWATLGSIRFGMLDPGFPCNLLGGKYFIREDINAAYSHFWANSKVGGTGLQTYYFKMLQHVVGALAQNTNNIVGYDVMNEPYMGTEWSTCVSSNPPLRFLRGCENFDQALNVFYKRAGLAIHAIEPNAIVWYEPNLLFGFGVPTYLGRIQGKEIGMTFHNYDLSSKFTRPIINAKTYQAQNQVPILEGEYGATPDINLIKQVLKANNAAMLSAIYWTYFNNPQYKFCSAFGLPRDPRRQGIVLKMNQALTGDNINTALLSILTEVYPSEVSGKPLFFVFDAEHRSFSFRYRPSLSTHLPTIITVPSILYPNGYTARVKNANIFSEEPGQLLVSSAGKKVVTVDISLPS